MYDIDQKQIEELILLLKVQTGGCKNKSGIKLGTAPIAIVQARMLRIVVGFSA